MASNGRSSSLSLDHQDWRRTVRLLNVPPGVTIEDVEQYFEDEAIGGPIEMIYLMPGSGVVEITFDNESG